MKHYAVAHPHLKASSWWRTLGALVVVQLLASATYAAPLCTWSLFLPSSNVSTTRTDVASVSAAVQLPSVARRYFIQSSSQRPQLTLAVTNVVVPQSLRVLFADNSNRGGAMVTTTSHTSSAQWGRSLNATACTSTGEGVFFELDDTAVALSAAAASLITIAHNPIVSSGLCLATAVLTPVVGDRASGVAFIEDSGNAHAGFTTRSFVSAGAIRANVTAQEVTDATQATAANISSPVRLFSWSVGASAIVTAAVDVQNTTNTTLAAAPRMVLRPALASTPSPSVADAAICTIVDDVTVDVKTIPAGGQGLLDVVTGYCYVFGTVSQLHHACEHNPLCLGYTTNFIDADGAPVVVAPNASNAAQCFTEVPLCMLFSGTASSDSWTGVYRVLYTKPNRWTLTAQGGQQSSLIERHACDTQVDVVLPHESSTAETFELSVWVAQSRMRSGFVDVFMNGGFLARCGADAPFMDGTLGVDRSCSLLYLCAAVNLTGVSANATTPLNISVVYQPTSSEFPPIFGCPDALTSVVTLTSSLSSTLPPLASTTSLLPVPVPTSPASLQSFPLNDVQSLPTVAASSSVWLSLDTTASSVFVYEVDDVVVELQQAANVSFGNVSWFVRNIGSVSGGANLTSVHTCSSSSGLVATIGTNTTHGLGHQCNTLYACGGVVNVSTASSSANNTRRRVSGILEIAISDDFLASSLGGCGGALLVRVTAIRYSTTISNTANGNDTTTSTNPFAFGSVTSGFTPLIGLAPANDTVAMPLEEEVLSAYYSWDVLPPTDQTAVTAAFPDADVIVASGFSGLGMRWATAPWGTSEGRLQHLNPNASYAVFIDQTQSTAASSFYIPTSAVTLSVSTTQSLLSPSAVVLVTVWAGYTILDVITCAQDAAYISQPVMSCVLSSCMQGYLLPAGTDSVTVFVDTASLGTNPVCDYGLAVVLNFSDANITTLGTADAAECWRCPLTQMCILPSQVCDGVVNCDGGSDEALCNQWQSVESNAVLRVANVTPNGTQVLVNPLDVAMVSSSTTATTATGPMLVEAVSLGACLQAALQYQMNVVVHNASLCVVYHVPETTLQSPTQFLTPAQGTSLYVALSGSIALDGSEYGSCTSAYQCSGHGVAVTSASLTADQGACSCICNVSMPYVGDHCDVISGTTTTKPTSPLRTLISIPIFTSLSTNETDTDNQQTVSVSAAALEAAVTSALVSTAALVKSVDTCSFTGWGPSAADAVVNGSEVLSSTALFMCNVAIANTTVSSRRALFESFTEQLQLVIQEHLPLIIAVGGHTSLSLSNDTAVVVATVGDTLQTSPYGNCTLASDAANTSSIAVTCTNQIAAMLTSMEQPFAIRAAVTADVPLSSIVLDMNHNGSSSTLRCSPAHDASGVGGCVSSVCLFDRLAAEQLMSARSVVVTATIGNSSAAQTTPIAQQWCAVQASPAVLLEVLHGPTLPPSSVTGAHLVTSSPTFKKALIGVGIAVLAVAFILLIVSAVFLIQDGRIRARLHEEASIEPTKVTKLLHESFARLKYYVRTPERFRYEHWGVVLFVIGYNLAIAGGVLLLVAYFYPPDATYRVSVESYADDQCSLSMLSGTPRAQLMIDPSQGCSTSGSSVGSGGFGRRAVSATCEFVNGSWWAHVIYGSSMGDCHAVDASWPLTDNTTESHTTQRMTLGLEQGQLWVRNGSCVASPSFFPDPFISVYCGDASSEEARLNAIRSSLGGRLPLLQPDSVVVRSPPVLSTTGAAEEVAAANLAGAITTPFVADTKVRISTSLTEEFVASVASSAAGQQSDEQLPGNSRLVYQTAASFEAMPSETLMNPTLEAALNMPSLSIAEGSLHDESLATFLPLPDTLSLNEPIGFHFHSSGDDSATPPPQALYGDQRYYRLSESAQDIGYYFGPDTSADGYGFTVSFYGRFDSAAEGFVFIATDAVEEHDPSTGLLRSPVVDAATVMEAQLLSGDEWFETPLHVYYALYVSASTNRMHFVMADPVRAKTSIVDVSGNSSRYARAIFGLETLGAGGSELFNGEWHHVAVVLKNENSDVKAQLFVDGFYDTSGTQCLPRRPTPVDSADWGVGTTMSTLRPLSATAFQGGALYVGAFKGSVAALRFEPTAVAALSLIVRGTAASRKLHNLHRDEIHTIGVVLVALAVVLALFTVCGSGYAVSVDSNKNEDSDEASAVAGFVKVTRHEVEEEAPTAGRTFTQRYPRPSFSMSKRWLGLTRPQLTLFIDELRQSCKYPHRELLRTMYLMRLAHKEGTTPDTSMPLPSYEAWKEMVAHDLEHPRAEKKEFFWQSTTSTNGHVDDKLHPLEVAMQHKRSNLSEVAYVAMKEEQALMQKRCGEGAQQDDLGQDAAEANVRTAGAAHVDTGGGIGSARDGMGGAGMSTRAVGGQGANSMTNELYQIILPVISSLQTVYVWMSSISIPGNYGDIFGEFFSATAIDIARVVQSLAAYATPLMQLLAGLIVVGGLYYLCAVDNRMFQWYLARYTLRRDQIERRSDYKHRTKKKTDAEHLMASSSLIVAPVSHKSPLAPPSEAQQDKGVVIEGQFGGGTGGAAAAGIPVVPAPNRFASIVRRPLRYAHSLVSSSYLDTFPDPFDDTVSSDLSYSVAIMPLPQCQKIDRFCKEDDLPSFLTETVAESIEAVDDDGVVISLNREDREGCVPYKNDYSDIQGREYVVVDPDAKEGAPLALPPQLSSEHNPASDIHLRLVDVGPENKDNPEGVVLSSHLEVLGCYCRRHPFQRLSPLLQTIVWPFEDPPTCCVVSNGMRCDQRSGLIFRCGHHGKTTEGSPYSCDYAICEKHYRGKLKDVLLAQLTAIRQLIRDRGWSWALAVVFVTIGNAAYTPFMKTALMIVSCNTYFECVFSCWDAPDATFIVAAFLCIVMLVVFGLGVPAIQVSLLRFRRHQLETIFLSSEYGGTYAAVEAPTPRLERMGFGEFVFGIFTGSSIAPIIDYVQRQAKSTTDALLDPDSESPKNDEELGHPGEKRSSFSSTKRPHTEVDIASPTKGNMLPLESATAEDEDTKTKLDANPTVSVAEWSRFLATDPTAMAMLYNTMELRYMHLSPILLLWKVVMISQVVFLEQGSLGQRQGMAIVEILFAALVFFTAPFTSPVVDAMYRLASIHQLLLLGLQNLDTVNLIDGKPSIGLVMIAISLLYLAICAVVIAITMVWPAVVSIRDKQQSQDLLRSLGFQFSGTTTLYVTPVVGKGVMVEERASFRSTKGVIVKPHHAEDADVNNAHDADGGVVVGALQPLEQAPAPIGSVNTDEM